MVEAKLCRNYEQLTNLKQKAFLDDSLKLEKTLITSVLLDFPNAIYRVLCTWSSSYNKLFASGNWCPGLVVGATMENYLSSPAP